MYGVDYGFDRNNKSLDCKSQCPRYGKNKITGNSNRNAVAFA